MEEPIRDPAIPYAGPIRGGRFSPGKIVRIEGIVPGTAYRFNINLQCGSEIVPRDDVAVQIAVRILDGYIALNSLQNGIWGEEQVCTTLPIKRADRFDISIKCHFNQYAVIINGQHFCDFPQRIHYDRITHLTIDGDVSITQIVYTSGEMETIGGGDVWLPQTTAPVPILPVQNDNDNFEIINTNNSLATPPPSYDAAVLNKPIGFAAAGGPPYPTSAPYPTASPYPPTGSPYAPTTTPYPTGAMPTPGSTPYGAAYGGTPYPTGVPGINSNNYYPPPGAPGIPPPPPGAPVPLNAASSNFRPVRTNSSKKCISIVGGIAIAIALIIMAIMIKKNKKRSSYHYND